MARDIRRYKRRALFAQAVSVAILLFGLIAVVSYFNASLVGIPPVQRRYYEGQLLWLFSGISFVGFGLAFLVVSYRRSRRSIWLVTNTLPVAMMLTLEIEEDSDSTTYYAKLRNAHETTPRWRTWVDPGFNGRSVVGSEIPAQVFVDPKFNTPAAIRIEQGMLWANPFSRDSLQ